MNGHDFQRRAPNSCTHQAIEHDYAQILHSAAFRALGGKSQSLELNEGGITPRTRLTHSLEVARIGGRIAHQLGAHTRLVQAAGLAHDLGHPPFGHYGESVLNTLAADAGGFEANAQTLRILTLLEPAGEHPGLNLTRATLDATCKYPWPRTPGTRKFGVFDEDLETFTWVRQDAPKRSMSLEAQIMDWADDIANAVADFDDGIRAGLIRPSALAAPEHRQFLSALAADRISHHPPALIDHHAQKLLRLAPLAHLTREGFHGTPAHQAALHELAHSLTTQLTNATHVRGENTERHHAHLHVAPHAQAQAAWLTAAALHHVLRQPVRRQRRTHYGRALTALFEDLHRNPHQMHPLAFNRWEQAATDAQRTRALIDHLACLTEPQVMADPCVRATGESI